MLVLKGSTPHFQVYYDDQLAAQGIDGPALADAALAHCEADFATLSTWFGGITPTDLPIRIDIVWNDNGPPGVCSAPPGGACTNGHNYIKVNATASSLPIQVNEVALAELGEIFMETQGRGWSRASSNGEALSRVLPQA